MCVLSVERKWELLERPVRSIQYSDDLMGYQIAKGHFSPAAITFFECETADISIDTPEEPFIF